MIKSYIVSALKEIILKPIISSYYCTCPNK